MTVTTIETYKVDGVDLTTLAWNITTLGGRSGLPEVRGENTTIPFRPGTIWQEKMWGERTDTLSMWVLGCDEDGMFPVEHSRRAQLNQNLRTLKKLFAVRHRLLELEKVVDMPDGPLTLIAQAECLSTLDPSSMAGGTRMTFTADLRFPDPFWYGEEIEETVTSEGLVIDQPGDTLARKMEIELEGPLTNPRLTNTTLGVQVRYSGTIPEGQSVVLDTDQFTALHEATPVIQFVTHSGSEWWMALLDGTNSMTLDNWQGGSVGAGSAVIRYRPPYL